MGAKCDKRKVYREVFCVTLFVFHAPFFTLRISRQGRHLHENSKEFVVYFFVALIKHEIRLKCKKGITSVSYFMVCFAKYPRNAEHEKCTAGLLIANGPYATWPNIQLHDLLYCWPWSGPSINSTFFLPLLISIPVKNARMKYGWLVGCVCI